MKPYDMSYVLVLLLPYVCAIAAPPINLLSLGRSPANPPSINPTIYANNTTLSSILQNLTKAVFPPPDPLGWDTPNMTLAFRDYRFQQVYNSHDVKAAIEQAISEAATSRPQTLFPPGGHQWTVGSASLDCNIESYESEVFMTYGGWMQALDAMWAFNQNYKKVAFAVDLYMRTTDAQGHTELSDQGDCYFIF